MDGGRQEGTKNLIWYSCVRYQVSVKTLNAIASIAAVAISASSCGFADKLSKGHCMNTTRGYEICVKPDEVDCETDSAGDIKCSAYGTRTSLTVEGEKEHWSTSQEENSFDDNLWCKIGGELRNTDSFTCEAAKVHGKVS